MEVDATILTRGGTAARLASVNPVLARRRICVEWDTGQAKVGDGTTAWNDLPYIGDGGSGHATEGYVDAAVAARVPTAAEEIASYQTNAMWGECFGRIIQAGISCADNGFASLSLGGGGFSGDTDVYGEGSWFGLKSLTILKPGWHKVISYAHHLSVVEPTGWYKISNGTGTDNSEFAQTWNGDVWPGVVLSAFAQVSTADVIWVPPDDVPYNLQPYFWQKSGAPVTLDFWCGAWPFLIDEES